MILYVFDFWGIVVLVIFLMCLGLCYRLVLVLAEFTERLIALFVQTGLHRLAKATLAIIVGYTEDTYRRSRFILWNQVYTRLTFLWGSILAITLLLALLKFGRKIDSITIPLAVVLATYIGYRCLHYWFSSSPTGRALKSMNQDVNERTNPIYRTGPQLIRRWDYLDELFAQGA